MIIGNSNHPNLSQYCTQMGLGASFIVAPRKEQEFIARPMYTVDRSISTLENHTTNDDAPCLPNTNLLLVQCLLLVCLGLSWFVCCLGQYGMLGGRAGIVRVAIGMEHDVIVVIVVIVLLDHLSKPAREWYSCTMELRCSLCCCSLCSS